MQKDSYQLDDRIFYQSCLRSIQKKKKKDHALYWFKNLLLCYSAILWIHFFFLQEKHPVLFAFPLFLFLCCLAKKISAWEAARWIDQYYKLEERVCSTFFLLQKNNPTPFEKAVEQDTIAKLRELWGKEKISTQQKGLRWQNNLLIFSLLSLFFLAPFYSIKSKEYPILIQEEQKIALQSLTHSTQALWDSQEKELAKDMEKIASAFSLHSEKPEHKQGIESYAKDIEKKLQAKLDHISQKIPNQIPSPFSFSSKTKEAEKTSTSPISSTKGKEHPKDLEPALPSLQEQQEKKVSLQHKEMALKSALRSLKEAMASFNQGNLSAASLAPSESDIQFHSSKQFVWEKIQKTKETSLLFTPTPQSISLHLSQNSLISTPWPKKHSSLIQQYFYAIFPEKK
ncbi:MAG: hypothetical protein HUU50_13740 [Candidatus Brocadiae bacterium]|nr:hypothetical protein [Candidatus Brocadiia bacterium]